MKVKINIRKLHSDAVNPLLEKKEIMESAYNLSVPLIVSSSIGKTWKELR